MEQSDRPRQSYYVHITPRGFEPTIYCVKGSRTKPLFEGAKGKVPNYLYWLAPHHGVD